MGTPTVSAAGPRRRDATSGGGLPANGDVPWLTVRGAAHNNLQNIDVSFPLGRFTCVTGVSGSGKSSLVNDILHAALARELNRAHTARPGRHDRLEGVEHLDKVIAIDQSPIGRTPRSNPATYIKVFDEIRGLFARLPDAKLRGYKPGRFSFNVPARRGGGRCEACAGNGANRIEMDFLADVWLPCPVCAGRRFNRETLQVLYKGRSIADVLNCDVQQALTHFENVPRVRAMLQTLHDVGLDYIQLGQPAPTLSGGEAQRIKLARELVKTATGRTLYVLDEPTTGLHFDDIRKLLQVLHAFVDAGNTVVVIEHNLDVIKTADWVIDLGPEGGEQGGRVVFEGTPEEAILCAASYTGAALREVLRSAGADGASNAAGRESSGPAASGARPPAAGAAQPAVAEPSLDAVRVVGARQHNLKDLTVCFPRQRMTVCTGVSGSGKTSFAIDTVFVEGYRRYVESLSAYARQFLGQMAKPRVEHVAGLSPAICIEQKAAGKSPRSTVGTVTEIYDYMRVLWARVGTPYCPRCQAPVGAQTSDEIVDRVMSLESGAPIILLAPVRLGDGETYAALFRRLKNSGYTRVRIDGEIRLTAQAATLDARRKHRVEVVIDRTVVRPTARGRIAESVEHALALGDGVLTLVVETVETVEEERPAGNQATRQPGDGGARGSGPPPGAGASGEPQVARTPTREFMFSQKRACSACGTSYEELTPHHFSFNSPLGWCETCEGLGVQRGAPAEAIIAHPYRSLLDGAVAGWGRIEPRSPFGRMLVALCRHLGVAPTAPLRDWTPQQKHALMFGTEGGGDGGTRGGPGADWIDAAEAFPRTDGPDAGSRGPPGGATQSVRFQWRGFFPAIDAATRNSWLLRQRLHAVVTDIPCVTCHGGRLRPEAAAVRLVNRDESKKASSESASGGQALPGESLIPPGGGAADSPCAVARSHRGARPGPLPGKTIVEVCEMPLAEAAAFFRNLKLDPVRRRLAGELLKEIRDRLQFLLDVGLDYLTLHRAAPTLAGGEAQRIRLASQIGSGLSGVLYVLDEPTIGLHPRDNLRLIKALTKLRDLGNTLLLVEHDRDVIRHADHLLDFGPRAGAAGGYIVSHGPPAEFLSSPSARVPAAETPGPTAGAAAPTAETLAPPAMAAGPTSLTRAYLAGTAAIPIPTNRRPVNFDELKIV